MSRIKGQFEIPQFFDLVRTDLYALIVLRVTYYYKTVL